MSNAAALKGNMKISNAARERARMTSDAKTYIFPIQPPELFPGVVPKGTTAQIAMDSDSYSYAQSLFGYGNNPAGYNGFPGYPYLAMLATRAEYRAFAEALATEITREWIVLNSTESAGDETKERITQLNDEIKKLKLQNVIKTIAEHDALFGRGQMFLDIEGHDKSTPLILSPKAIKKGSKFRVVAVEPMWTTPVSYNALDPTAPDFYKPPIWWMLGYPVHASRLQTVVTRPLPDMLKPAFNFSGMSISQLSEPYVDNWIKTRKSVGDLITNFSTTILKTAMDAVLQGGSGEDLFSRIELFTLARTNRGVMAVDMDKEEVVQVNTPLSGLAELQQQSEEHMGLPSRMPMVVLTGISPTGLNASSEGEIRVWYDRIHAAQESNYREPIEIAIKVLQLCLFGEIDEDITIDFQPLYQMTPKELAEIRLNNSTASGNYIDRGVIDPTEERERLARDPESGYQGLDITMVPDAGNPQGEAGNAGLDPDSDEGDAA